MRISRVISPFVFLFLTACAFVQGAESPPVTQAPIILPQGTLVPTRERSFETIKTPFVTATPLAEDSPCSIGASQPKPVYEVDAELNYGKRVVKVAERIVYTNLSDSAFNTLVLYVKSNWQQGVFRLESITLEDQQEAQHVLSGQRLEITLPQPLHPACTVTISLRFDVHVPAIDRSGLNAYQGYLGYSDRQTNLGHWLPVMAVRQNGTWITHDEIGIGEQELLAVADWNIQFRITNAPDTVRVAAPGSVENIDAYEWRITLPNARDFSISVGENYRRAQQETSNDTVVELYTFNDTVVANGNGTVDAADYALTTAVKSVGLYESLYGALALKRLVIVEADFPDGMEFSGMVFVGGEYFRGLTGVESYLTIITVHEIAHQWWYGQVGSDQALYPWMDEALATYSELFFIEQFYPSLSEWWWDFRVKRWQPQGFVDGSVYDFATRRSYINAVYLHGVQMLHELRQALGDDVFLGWLKRYAAAGTGQIMTPDAFWSLLTSEQLSRTAAIRERYLRQPPILSEQSEPTATVANP